MALSISHVSSSTLYRVPPSCGPTTSLASILSLACTHFNVSPSDHDLQQTLPNKSVKWVDPTLTLRLANFKHGTKLALMKNHKKAPQGASSSTPVRIALELSGGVRVESSFPPSTSLWSVLCAMESEHSLQLTTLVSVPPPERGALFELTINIPGYMQPVVDFMQQRCDTIEKLQETTLAQLGITKGAAKLKVTHKYIPPHMTPQQQQHILQQFNETWNKRQHELSATTTPDTSSATTTSTSSSTYTPAAASASAPAPASTPPAPVVIPADRSIRAWYASVGVLRPDVLPDSFYEPTEEDAQMYARAIHAEATAAKAALLAERVHKKQATSTDEKGTAAAPSSSPDTSSSSSHVSRWSFNNSFSSKRGADFGVALLKLRFPNHIYVQAMFRSDETLADLHTWLRTHVLDPKQLQVPASDNTSTDISALSSSPSPSTSTSTTTSSSSSPSSTSYELFITPPRTVLRDDPHMTLAQAQLVPAASIHFKSIIHTSTTTPTPTPTPTVPDDTTMTDIQPSPGTGLLLPQLLNKLIILPPPPAPALATPSTTTEEHLHPATAPANIDQSTVSTSTSTSTSTSASVSSSSSVPMSDVPLSGTT